MSGTHMWGDHEDHWVIGRRFDELRPHPSDCRCRDCGRDEL